jgi:hypothetical protein
MSQPGPSKEGSSSDQQPEARLRTDQLDKDKSMSKAIEKERVGTSKVKQVERPSQGTAVAAKQAEPASCSSSASTD